MPTYVYSCKCGAREEEKRLVVFRDNPKLCSACRGSMTRLQVVPVNVPPERFPYVHNNLGADPVVIHSRAQEKSIFAERGLVDAR